MAWIGADLQTFPFEVWADDVRQSPIESATVNQFAGLTEQIIDYAGPKVLWYFTIGVGVASQEDCNTFSDFYVEHKTMKPFKWKYLGKTYYVRFDGTFTLSWFPPVLGKISFNVREMHPKDIVS